ncbi:hypothetical protein NN561_012468 [Cricetulus griseus]
MLSFASLEDPGDEEDMEVFGSGSASGNEVSVVGGTGWKSACSPVSREILAGRESGVPGKPPPFPGAQTSGRMRAGKGTGQ